MKKLFKELYLDFKCFKYNFKTLSLRFNLWYLFQTVKITFQTFSKKTAQTPD